VADEYYSYDLVADAALAAPGPAVALDILAKIGHRLPAATGTSCGRGLSPLKKDGGKLRSQILDRVLK
jgi:hypothetical protein